jgi:hypothetical protein
VPLCACMTRWRTTYTRAQNVVTLPRVGHTATSTMNVPIEDYGTEICRTPCPHSPTRTARQRQRVASTSRTPRHIWQEQRHADPASGDLQSDTSLDKTTLVERPRVVWRGAQLRREIFSECKGSLKIAAFRLYEDGADARKTYCLSLCTPETQLQGTCEKYVPCVSTN